MIAAACEAPLIESSQAGQSAPVEQDAPAGDNHDDGVDNHEHDMTASSDALAHPEIMAQATKSGLDQLVEVIRTDAKLVRKVEPEVVEGSAIAMAQLNDIIVQELNAMGAMKNGYVSSGELLELNQRIRSNPQTAAQWKVLSEQVGAVIGQGSVKLVGRNAVNRVTASITQLGNEYNGNQAAGNFKNANGSKGADIFEVNRYVNGLLELVHTHGFRDHASMMLGDKVLAPNQEQYSGYTRDGNEITAKSTITGLRPIIEQAIDQVKAKNPKLTGAKLESAVAKQLTNLNDWKQLKPATQEAVKQLTGVDFDAMSGKEREVTINHLQHSPLPFGDLNEPLSPDARINYGITHTLDKSRTRVEDLGNGQFRIRMISNNNNGSHTGHSMGSFVVQFEPGVTPKMAKNLGNKMVVRKNNNNRLLLDSAAKDILDGKTPRLDPKAGANSYKGGML